MEGKTILSIIFLLSSLIYALFAVNVLNWNDENKTNKTFFVMCLLLSVWSYSYAFCIAAHSVEKAIFWLQVAAIGWCLLYPLTNIYLLQLQEYKFAKNKKMIFLFLLPGIILMILHTSFGDFSRAQFNPVMTIYGYINKDVLSPVYTFYTIFYIVNAIIFTFLVIRWYFDLKRKNNQRLISHLKKFIFSYLITVILFTTSEYYKNIFFDIPLSKMAAIFFILPVSTTFFLLKNTDFVKKNFSENKNVLLTDSMRKRLFEIMGYVFIFYSYISLFIFYYIKNSDEPVTFVYSIFMISAGIIYFIIPHFSLDKEYSCLIFTLIALFLILITAYKNSFNSGISTWATGIILIIVSGIFENKIYSFIITISLVLSNIYFVISVGKINTTINSVDYYIRIITMLFTYFLISYTNEIYIKRTKDVKNQVETQKLLTDITSKLINIDKETEEKVIVDILRAINYHFEFERSIIYRLDENTNSFELEFHQDNEKFAAIKNLGKIYESYPIEKLSWSLNGFKNGKSLIILNIDSFPDGDFYEKEIFLKKDIKGLLAYPLFIDNTFYGLCLFEMPESRESFPYEGFFNILVNLIANGKKKIFIEDELYKNANFDQITGLMNTKYFTKKLQEIIDSSKKDRNLAVINLDIVKFSSINEAFGFVIGDKVLNHLANILKNEPYINSLIARNGADDFIFVSKDFSSVEDLEKNIIKTLEKLKNPTKIDNFEFVISADIGISIYNVDGTSAKELIDNASLALNHVKNYEIKEYLFCNEEIKKSEEESVAFTERLYHALQKKEFIPLYKVQMNSETSKIEAVEIVLAWHDKIKNITLPPEKFMPILEKTSLIIDVGEWLIDSILGKMKYYKEEGYNNLTFAINLSAVQFLDENLISFIDKKIKEYQINPENLELEISESIAIQQQDIMAKKFEDLKKLHTNIALDNFGMEYSSLSKIQSFPVDKIKIDKSFISGIGKDSKKEAIIKIIIKLANIIGVSCIAEGVMEKHQVDFLKENGCYLIQGYYYSKPLFESDFIEFLKKNY